MTCDGNVHDMSTWFVAEHALDIKLFGILYFCSDIHLQKCV